MPSAGDSRITQREHAFTRGAWGWEEFAARHHVLNDALARLGWPASKRDVSRCLRALSPQDGLPAESVTALPERRYESIEDVRYTLDALGAFPHPSRFS